MGTSGTPTQYVIVDHLGAFFFEPDLFDNNVPFDNTIPIYLISKALEIRVRIRNRQSSTILAFFTENIENKYYLSRISWKVTSC